MKKTFSNLVRITVWVTILSLAGLVMSGLVMAQQCVDNGNGTVTDNSAGLTWQKETAGPMGWAAAKSYADTLNLEGYGYKWRMPHHFELKNLYSSPCLSMMSVVKKQYWTGTSSHDKTLAMRVNFDNGDLSIWSKSNSYYVRAVHDGR